MQILSHYGQDGYDGYRGAVERAIGRIDLAQINGLPAVAVPAQGDVRYLVVIEDRDLGTLQSLIDTLMARSTADAG